MSKTELEKPMLKMSPSEVKRMKEESLKLIEEGRSAEEIMERTHLSKRVISGQASYLLKKKKEEEESPKVVSQSSQEHKLEVPGGIDNVEDSGKLTLAQLTEEEIRTNLQAVWRQVAMNPKNLLYYAFFQQKGFKGSLSDFFNSCVEDSMRVRGIRVAIQQNKEIA
jgi:hypothetical protein